jgi:single-strand DNA-binding protein
MAGVNKAILIGRLGRDPELKYLPNGTPVANFSLATSERIPSKDGGERQEKTEWHNVVVYSKLAELVNQYLKKGRSAYVEGRIQTRTWDDRDGNKKQRTEIVANVVQFLDSRESGGGGGGGGGDYSRPPRQAPSAAPADSYSQVEEPTVLSDPGPSPDDDLPF